MPLIQYSHIMINLKELHESNDKYTIEFNKMIINKFVMII